MRILSPVISNVAEQDLEHVPPLIGIKSAQHADGFLRYVLVPRWGIFDDQLAPGVGQAWVTGAQFLECLSHAGHALLGKEGQVQAVPGRDVVCTASR